ncbi:phosphatidylglycerol lysyltransferase domain-containing protein [Virgisporangium aurantiacum]|uniref:Phosphatidylglycerol lysyltransferase C-terminal domain-containing protein n=1 Tax=Virgisporangium aurantiacum TaxID=175570 RepID=A0A8J3Z4A8_9ACTN|nr:rhomboid family intramembrane serine protease [Virgisporangium aurantiacum]GIJ57334.1 hypothetical protein Vau01_048500 [Virgisporangium aurantiacum]
MSAVSVTGYLTRRFAAGAVLLLGAIDLVGAAATVPVRRPGVLGVDYAVAAVIGAHYVLLAAGVTAVVTARGIWRGKRTAWWLAVAAAVVSLPGHHVRDPHGRPVVASALVVLAVLVAGRRAFTARADPALARQGLAVLAAGLVSVLGYAVIGLYLLDSQFREPTSLTASIRGGVRLLFLLPVRFEPATRHERFFVDSVRVAALTVVAVALTRLVASVVGTPGHDAQRRVVAGILARHGSTALAHFHLLDDKNWVISDDHEAFVGYTVVGTSAVALGEPVGAPCSRDEAVRRFLELCALNGWTPVFHQVTAAGCESLTAHGLRVLKIGEEAVVDLASFTLDGRDRKGLRSAVRRCERAGYRIVDLPHPLDDAHLARLAEVSDAWLASGGHRERTFTLGRFDPGYLHETPVVAVVDDAGTVWAFANLLPPYRGRDASFDLMRRRPDAANGVMEFLFVALIERFRRDGYSGMNLGLAPLSGAGTGDTVADRVIRTLYRRGGAAFNFAGLRAYKDKWGPRWEPRYLAYRFDADLPKAAVAVARAGELPDPRSPLTRAVGLVRRYPASIAFAALQLWIMAATAADPHLHHVLLRHFGLAWADLRHGQVWRLVTGPFVQTRPGFVWSNLALVFLVFPVAERRLGTRRMAAVFLGGDWVSTVPVLLGVRIAVAAGVAGAAATLAERDAGSSSGSFALIAATLLTVAAPRVRWSLIAVLVAALTVTLAVDQRLFDLQHLISAVATVAVLATAARWRRPPQRSRSSAARSSVRLRTPSLR